MAYSQKQIEETFNSIIERIENGESLRSILKDENMPSRPLFYKWIKEDENKFNHYARATELRAENIFDEIFEIADNIGEDVITLEDGKEIINHGIINRDRLRIDTRKWALSKMNPKKYGDKIELDNKHSGEIKTEPKINLIVNGKTFNLKEKNNQ